MTISRAASLDRSTRSCPACLCNKTSHLWDNRLEPIDGLDLSYKLGSCRACGFIYAYHLSSPSTFTRYYRHLSKYDYSGTEYSESAVDVLRATTAIEICKSYLETTSQIADIGCGIGYLLSCFRKQGYQYLWGIDPGLSSPQSALQCFGLEGICTGSINDVSSLIPISDIRLVTLTGVLEHLWDVRSDFSRLVSSMTQGSYILIEVPALENFDALMDEPFGELSLEHIQFFSVQSLNNFMGSVGLSCVQNVILPLPSGTADSLFGLYQISQNPSPEYICSKAAMNTHEVQVFTEYLETSSLIYSEALQKIPLGSFILYGAGSHTARLLASLTSHQRDKIVAVVDSNPNLAGKTIGNWVIEPPGSLSVFPNVPVVVSSYRSQSAISSFIRQHWDNPIVTLYEISN
jgi:hypothetical protein